MLKNTTILLTITGIIINSFVCPLWAGGLLSVPGFNFPAYDLAEDLSDRALKRILSGNQAVMNDSETITAIRGIIGYIWRNGGWASVKSLADNLNMDKRVVRSSAAFIDMDRLKEESIKLKKAVPLFFNSHSKMERSILSVKIVELLGYRASLAEIKRVIGYKVINVAGCFPSFKKAKEVEGFIADVNHNRELMDKQKVQVLAVGKEITEKRHQDLIVNVAEALGGRYSSSEVIELLGRTRATINEQMRKMDLNSINIQMEHQSRPRIMKPIRSDSKLVQDEILHVMEQYGGIANLGQISDAIYGEYVDRLPRIASKINFEELNRIRFAQGLFPFYIISKSDQKSFKQFLRKKYSYTKNTQLATVIEPTIELYKEYFGETGLRVFKEITIPFAVMAVFGNNDNRVGGRTKVNQYERKMNIFQQVLLTIIETARSLDVHENLNESDHLYTKYSYVSDFFIYAATRAINISRKELEKVSVENFNVSYGFDSERVLRRSGVTTIFSGTEKQLKIFKKNLLLAISQLTDRNVKIAQPEIEFSRIKKLKKARERLKFIQARENSRYNRASLIVHGNIKPVLIMPAEPAIKIHIAHLTGKGMPLVRCVKIDVGTESNEQDISEEIKADLMETDGKVVMNVHFIGAGSNSKPMKSLIEYYVRAGVGIITLDWEIYRNKKELFGIIKNIRKMGCSVGISYNPLKVNGSFLKFISRDSGDIDLLLINGEKADNLDYSIQDIKELVFDLHLNHGYNGLIGVNNISSADKVLPLRSIGVDVFEADDKIMNNIGNLRGFYSEVEKIQPEDTENTSLVYRRSITVGSRPWLSCQ